MGENVISVRLASGGGLPLEVASPVPREAGPTAPPFPCGRAHAHKHTHTHTYASATAGTAAGHDQKWLSIYTMLCLGTQSNAALGMHCYERLAIVT